MQEQIDKLKQEVLGIEKGYHVKIQELTKVLNEQQTKFNLFEEKILKIHKQQEIVEQEQLSKFNLLEERISNIYMQQEKIEREINFLKSNSFKTNPEHFQKDLKKLNKQPNIFTEAIQDLQTKPEQTKEDSIEMNKWYEENILILQEQFNTLEKDRNNFEQQIQNDMKYYQENHYSDIKTIQQNIQEIQSEMSIVREQQDVLGNNPMERRVLEENNKLTLGLFEVVKEGHLDYLQFLIKMGANVNTIKDDDRSPLHYAAINGHASCVKELIKNNANIECKDEYMRTPLHYAAIKEHLSVVTELLKHNANIESKDLNELTPLHSATMHRRVSVVKLLIEKQANIESKDKDKFTPLHHAALNGHVSVVTELIKNKADIESKDQYEKTPLQCAALKGHALVVMELIKNNADIHSKNVDGKTALDLAIQHNHQDVIPILEKYMALSKKTTNVNFENIDTK